MHCSTNLLLPAIFFLFLIKSTLQHEATTKNEILVNDFIPKLNSYKLIFPFYNRTVYLLPESENACTYRYNYVCKFWFYVRCVIFHDIPESNFRIITDSQGGLKKALELMKPNDILIFTWRSSDHELVPPVLQYLSENQKDSTSIVSKIRYGVFHIGNESKRENWKWYKLANFVLRNYWVHDLPSNVQYIPLGPQLPFECEPNFIYNNFESESQCRCRENLKINISSDREYLWSFSGSLRGGRQYLLNEISKNEILNGTGLVQIATKFGGDGNFGSEQTTRNPKTKHLELIKKSAFVFSPCGNVMETHRIYEAIMLGSIPVIEQCDRKLHHFFPFRSLLFQGAENMINFVVNSSKDLARVNAQQADMLNWWRSYMIEIGKNVSNVILTDIPYHLRGNI